MWPIGYKSGTDGKSDFTGDDLHGLEIPFSQYAQLAMIGACQSLPLYLNTNLFRVPKLPLRPLDRFDWRAYSAPPDTTDTEGCWMISR